MVYLLRRTVFYVLTAIIALSINFFIPRLMPGNPIDSLLARFSGRVTPRTLASLNALFGLQHHEGLWGQYFAYWRALLHGNLGISFTYFPTAVSHVIGASLPWTLVLVGLCTVLSFIVGTAVGCIVGWKPGSFLDNLLPLTTFFSSIPYFWLGLIALFVFSGLLHWLPVSGAYDSSVSIGWTWSFIASALDHAILPAATLVISTISFWLLRMRNMMVTTLGEDYILLAEAKGLSRMRIMAMYGARNAILPNIASFAMALGFVVTGSILLEVVFSYPGIGFVLYQAVSNEDYPLMQGIFLVVTLVVLLANFLADFCYILLDPRARDEA
jgi:peptide/nickel transport system permease protein